MATQGGTHEQHQKAGHAGQEKKNTNAASHSKSGETDDELEATNSGGKSTQGGTHEQHVNAGRQSHKNTPSSS